MAAKKSTKKAQSKAQSKRGGKRVGAGPKTKAATLARQDLNAAVDAVITTKALDLVANLQRLADGGYERGTVTRELATSIYREEPACLVMRREPVRDEKGRPVLDPETGQPVTVEVPAFPNARPNEKVQIPVYPNAKPGELVIVRLTTEVADGDRAANEYLLNRRLGKPKQAVELSGPDGAAIPVSFEEGIGKIYGEGDPEE